MKSEVLHLPCGGTAYFDTGSGCSFRCSSCFATVGSIGQPDHCRSLSKQYEQWEILGGAGWDYSTGKPKTVTDVSE